MGPLRSNIQKVHHRVDGLEITHFLLVIEPYVHHRVDGLEMMVGLQASQILVHHRVDGLEIHGIELQLII